MDDGDVMQQFGDEPFDWDDQRDEVVLLDIFRWHEVAGDRINGEAATMAASGVQEIEGGKQV